MKPEKEFLIPDLEKAKAGPILEIGPIHPADQQRLVEWPANRRCLRCLTDTIGNSQCRGRNPTSIKKTYPL
ncbi:hypothetical protein CMK12_10990 [Candidatus Poribacteria bacterium]|nr:hypothetical protein [Candidatus Poribacteria bacterium]